MLAFSHQGAAAEQKCLLSSGLYWLAGEASCTAFQAGILTGCKVSTMKASEKEVLKSKVKTISKFRPLRPLAGVLSSTHAIKTELDMFIMMKFFSIEPGVRHPFCDLLLTTYGISQ